MEKDVYSQSLCLMNEVVELYYIKGMNQLDIATELNISKPTVSRVLKQAGQNGMVEFRIKEPYMDCLKLQKELLEKYPIKQIYVVPVVENETNGLEVKKAVAKEGARHLQRILNSNQMLGLAWGGTMHHMIQMLNPCQKKNTRVITMHGDLSQCGEEYDVKNLVRRAAMAFSGKRFILGVPGYFDQCQRAEKFKEQNRYKDFCKFFEKITISVAGAGCWKPASTSPLRPSESNYLSKNDLDELNEKRVAADFLLHFLDVDGNEIESEIKKRTISIDLELYKQIPYKIVLLSGSNKAYAAKAILKGGFADVLFLDYQLAKKLYYL